MELHRPTTIKALHMTLILCSFTALLRVPFLVKAWVFSSSILSDASEPISFGASVALSPSGNFLAVGAPSEAVNAVEGAGVVWVFSVVDERWSLVAKITSAIPQEKGAFGFFLVMTEDQLITSATEAKNGTGVIEAFKLSGSDWIPHGVIAGKTPGDRLGSSLTLNDEGSILVAGAAGCNNECGCIYVLTLDGDGKWIEHAKLSGATSPKTRMGSLGIDVDQATIMAGAPDENNAQGAVYLWAKRNADITPTAQRLTAAMPLEDNSAFGLSTAILSPTMVAVGAPHTHGVFIFCLSATSNSWLQDSIVSAPGGAMGFGFKLVSDSGRLLISSLGAPMIYTVSGNTVSDSYDVLVPTDGIVSVAYGLLGASIRGNVAVFGDGTFGARHGAGVTCEGVYIFRLLLG